MGKYIGRELTYGLFEKQNLVPNGIDNEFPLNYQVGSVGSILVVYSGDVQEPGVDYALSDGGTKIVFSFVPSIGFPLYLIYMGKELQVPSVSGNFPVHHTAIGNNVQTVYTLPLSPLAPAALMIFNEGILQRHVDHWTLLGADVTFLSAPGIGEHLDFYIHGIERTDLVTVDPLSITNDKIANNTITGEKLNLIYEPYPSTPVVETFGTMDFSNLVVQEAEFLDTGQIIKVRLCFSVDLTGGDNKVRVSLPINNSGSANVTGNVTITTDSYFENGIIRWGDVSAIDIYRAFGVNYLNENVLIAINLEYESE